MKLILYMATCMLASALNFCKAQIGTATIKETKLAVTNVGASSSYGKSTLPVCAPRSISCSQAFTYTFTGTGNWTLETNWENNMVPPAVLPEGATIIIDPIVGGECILNITQTIAEGANLKVVAGKKLRVLSNLVIQN